MYLQEGLIERPWRGEKSRSRENNAITKSTDQQSVNTNFSRSFYN